MPESFEKHLDSVYRFALSLSRNRHLAEDLTQDCFLRAHQRSSSLKSATATKSWLFQILVNLWKDHLKKKRLNTNEFAIESVFTNQDPQMLAQQNEQVHQLLDLMQTLPSRQRSVLHLSIVEQFSNSEIAVLLESTENSVKANLSIARNAMRKKIVELEGIQNKNTQIGISQK